jgi:AraC family transcriptional regulator
LRERCEISTGTYAPRARKYPSTSQLLASSAGLGWSSIAAEIRSHGIGEAWGIIPQSAEIFLVVAGNEEGLVRRNAAGFRQEATPRTGAIWLSPAGVDKDIAITSPIPGTAHFYLPATLFAQLKNDFKLPANPAGSIRNEAGIGDEVVECLGRSILAELAVESAASRMYVEYASLTLAARLLQRYSDSGASTVLETSTHRLDNPRLRRVLDYIDANLKKDISLEDLAGIAGYSLFHFARKFTAAMGIAPHRYISQARIKVAMAELAAGKLPLAEIAFKAHFSSQASFTRAFRRATSMTPLEYRRRRT